MEIRKRVAPVLQASRKSTTVRHFTGLKAFSTRIATNLNDLPRTSPHGSDLKHDF